MRAPGLAVAAMFPGQCEDDPVGISVVGGFADLVRFLAPRTPDLEE